MGHVTNDIMHAINRRKRSMKKSPSVVSSSLPAIAKTARRIVHCLPFAVSLGAFAWDSPTIAPGRALIFPDDSQIAAVSNVTRCIHAAVKDMDPVLKKDRPWESKGCHVYGSVYRQADGSYRMWYNDWSRALVADSKDGKTWVKPYLTVYASEQFPSNNMCRDAWGHCISLIDDRFEKNPERRYKLIGCSYKFEKDWSINKEITGYYGSCSADGLVFKGSKRLLYGWDTISMAQHPETGEIFVYHKICTPWYAGREDVRRVVFLSRTRDFVNFTKPEIALAPDEADDMSFTENQNQRMDIYTHTAFPYAGGFIGFPTMFRIDLRNPSGHGQTSDQGFCDVQLATSRDGVNWMRTPGRKTVITYGEPGNWDCGGIWGVAGGELVNIGKETMVYYYGLDNAHGRKLRKEQTLIATGRAVWRRWGFASMGCSGSGTFTTRPVKFGTGDVRLNLRPVFDPFKRGGASVTVSVLSESGKVVLAVSEPVGGDDTLAKLSWKGGRKVPVGKPVRLRFDVRAAAVYAVECM